jgi:hypothetical protein
LAAPGKPTMCERCFAPVQSTDQICPECGAPLHSAGSVQVVESAVHADLAQANLLRLRGERDAAEKKCLSILKRYPNEPEAHSLLGELSADREDYPRAIEWFELALDLNPNSATDKARLEELKAKVHSADAVKTEEQLGLPPQVNYLPWIAGIVLLIVVLVGVAAWRAPKKDTTSVKGGVVEAPQESNGKTINNSAGAVPPATGSVDGNSSRDASAPSPVAFSMEDRTLLEALQRGMYGASILSVDQDPRDKVLMVTYAAPKLDEARRAGAIIAKDALDRSPESDLVTVRGVNGDQIVFVADASRPRLAEIEGENNQDLQSGNDSWISNFLQREWPSAPSSSSSTSSSPGGTASTSTTASQPSTSPQTLGTTPADTGAQTPTHS